jgi:agmatine deiminase
VVTPRERGFAMPPEWAPHARCWMAWPCRPDVFEGRAGDAARAWAEVARAIARFEPVTMLANADAIAEASVHGGKGVSVLPMAYDDSWARDIAPTFLLGAAGALAGIDWPYDGYGQRMPSWSQDDALATLICERLGIERFRAPLVIEAGSFHVDGEGTALALAPAILDPKRNPGLDRAAAERVLGDHLGVETVIWLDGSLEEDPALGHLEDLAMFAAPGRVLALVARGAGDPRRAALAANLDVLKNATDAQGRTLEVVEIPAPKPRPRADGRLLVTSYVSLYLANGGVVLPMFGDSADNGAFDLIEDVFPDRAVVQVEALDIVHGGGGIHGITQQQPAPPEAA